MTENSWLSLSYAVFLRTSSFGFELTFKDKKFQQIFHFPGWLSLSYLAFFSHFSIVKTGLSRSSDSLRLQCVRVCECECWMQ